MDAKQPAQLGDASVAQCFRRVPLASLSPMKEHSPVTSRSSSTRAPFSRHRLLGGNEVAAVQDTSKLAKTSRRKARANSFRFSPMAEISNVTSMSETRRSRGNPSVPETPSSRPLQNPPASVLPDLPAFVGIRRNHTKHRLAALRWAMNQDARLKIATRFASTPTGSRRSSRRRRTDPRWSV